MRGPVPAAVLAAHLLGAVLLRAQDPVFVEVVTPARAYAGQRIPFELRVGIERAFLMQNVVQPFQQELGMPLQLRAVWLGGGDGIDAVRWTQQVAGGATFVVNEEMASGVAGEQQRDGRTFATVTLRGSLSRSKPGTIRLEPATATCFHATQFEDSVVHGRRALDRQELRVQSNAAAIEIVELPVAGRPADFAGAVGRFTLQASADRTTLQLGDSFRATLVLRSDDGDCNAVRLPRLQFDWLRVQGVLDDEGIDERRITVDLAVTGGATELPPIGFVAFDPVSASYQRVQSAAIPLRVRGAAPAQPPATSPTPTGTDTPEATDGLRERMRTDAGVPGRVSAAQWWIGLLLPWLFGALLLGWRLQHDRKERDPLRLRARAALGSLHRDLGWPDADRAAAFAEFIAAHLHVPAAAVVDAGLAARLGDAGIDAALAQRTAETLRELIGVRYGGTADLDASRITALAAELDHAFGAGTEGRR